MAWLYEGVGLQGLRSRGGRKAAYSAISGFLSVAKHVDAWLSAVGQLRRVGAVRAKWGHTRRRSEARRYCYVRPWRLG